MAVCGAPIFYYPITYNSDMDSREIEEDRDVWMEERRKEDLRE